MSEGASVSTGGPRGSAALDHHCEEEGLKDPSQVREHLGREWECRGSQSGEGPSEQALGRTAGGHRGAGREAGKGGDP